MTTPSSRPSTLHRLFLSLTLASAFLTPAYAADTPASSGPVATLDTPIFRIPMMKTPPTIDGIMEDKEWEDASALSGFWYDFGQADFRYLAPVQTQLQIYAGYDKDNLYILYRSPVYPEASWLKSRARFPDVVSHPQYGLQWDDHVELEMRPLADATKGYTYGLFRWYANPAGVVGDYFWSLDRGEYMPWKSNAKIRSGATDKTWTLEFAIPLKDLKVDAYAAKEDNGQDRVVLPPPDDTTYRFWFTRGIGGNGSFFNVFDKHVWNTTKTKMVLDSKAVGFQVNELGPIMEDNIDLKVTLKNHNSQSETVRMGFFVESAEGNIYSSYNDPATKDGLVELLPGEVKHLDLKKKFPGISKQGNVLWFDVRSAGTPAKVLFQTRLIEFHTMDPGGETSMATFRQRRVENIAGMRPPRRDFDFTFQYSPYTNCLSAIIDRGILGAAETVKRAVEAKFTVTKATADETLVAEKTVPFRGDFATALLELPPLQTGSYKLSLLLFDENKRIVGERNPDPFYKGEFEWEKNKLGRDDVVWAPYTPIKAQGNSVETLKHVYTIDPSGLPAQLVIKPDPRELPLELRAPKAKITDSDLQHLGRGPQLRAPVRFEAVVAGQRLPMQVVTPAVPTRQWKSEQEFTSKLKVGPLDLDLVSQYDCDGAMDIHLTYGSETPVDIDSLEMLMDVAGPVDMRIGEQGSGMAPTGGFEVTLPNKTGVVWDSAVHMQPGDLYYSRFVPFFFFGSGDRAFTWICDSDRPWVLDREGSTMTLERDPAGQVTWRVKFVNHKAKIQGRRTTEFVIQVSPAKPKPENYRRDAWFAGQHWAATDDNNELPNDGPGGIDGSDEAMALFKKRYPSNPPRLYINNWVNVGIAAFQKNAYTGEWLGNQAPVDSQPNASVGRYGQPWTRPGRANPRIEFGASHEDLFVYHLEREIRLAGIQGWWWDEHFPPFRVGTVATGNSYFRDPADVKENELPYQANYATLHVRSMFKRLARIFAANNVPNRTYVWANNEATVFESYVWDTQLIEGAGAYTSSYDLDHITTYPLSLIRYLAHPYNGLICRITSNTNWGDRGASVTPGDNKIHDRAILGRALLHDIGVTLERQVNSEQFSRMLKVLYEFGYFDDQNTEMIPYWRPDAAIRYGEKFDAEDAFATTKTDPYAKVYVGVYRRPFKTARGRLGAKALIIVQNESDQPVRSRLFIQNPAAVFGGPNNLTLGDITKSSTFTPEEGSQNHFSAGLTHPTTPALRDVEDAGALTKSHAAGKRLADEVYGPLYIPAHDFRVLYGQFDPDLK